MPHQFAILVVPNGSEPIEERIGQTLSDYLTDCTFSGRRWPDACGYIGDEGQGEKYDLGIYHIPDPLHPEFPGEPVGHAVCRELSDLATDAIRRQGFAHTLHAIGVSPQQPSVTIHAILVPDQLAVITALALSRSDAALPETSVTVLKYR